ncbi:hypothetical protein Tco_0156187 [Tanacetum coccineum]
MEDDLFAYELGVLEDFYFPCVEQPYDNLKNCNLDVYEPRQCYDEYERMFVEVVILIDGRLVKLIDITLEQWQLEVNGIDTNVECDPTNVEFAIWLASKFSNHMIIDWYTKNALWIYWKMGDDKEIDVDVLTGDLPRFKSYEDYKNTWIYEWNKEVPWVEEKPWLDDGTWNEPNDDTCHECNPFQFRSGHIEWPTCNLNKDGYCNGEKLPRIIQVEEYWWGKKEEEESSENAWSNYLPNDDNDAIQATQERFDNHEPMEDDDDIGDLDDYLIQNDAS